MKRLWGRIIARFAQVISAELHLNFMLLRGTVAGAGDLARLRKIPNLPKILALPKFTRGSAASPLCRIAPRLAGAGGLCPRRSAPSGGFVSEKFG